MLDGLALQLFGERYRRAAENVGDCRGRCDTFRIRLVGEGVLRVFPVGSAVARAVVVHVDAPNGIEGDRPIGGSVDRVHNIFFGEVAAELSSVQPTST